MGDLWTIPVLVFLAVLLAVPALDQLVFQAGRTRKAINRRLAESRQSTSATEALDAMRRERGFVDVKSPWLRGLNDLLMQTGLTLDRRLVLLSIVALGLLIFVLLGVVFGYHPVTLALALVLSFVFAYLFFRIMRQRRIARFAQQLPDAIDLIVRGVRVGYPLPVALGLVAREMPQPIGTEFGLTSDEITFGQDVKTAVEHLYRRVGQDDLLFLVVAINVQSQTGGNLAEILMRLSRLIRNRAKVQLKIRALTAEGRVSAKFLTAMPFVLFAVVSLISPSYFGEIRHHPIVVPALIYAAVSLLIGNIMMHRMVNFRF
ncbi:MAG: type II secretion system F family protein [Bradyrhizobiaceae bacterium]|nr:type II secretion system F family protein [Bradyrhizobiaceae bacterium]